MYIDTHTHLNFKAFEKDLSEVIKSAVDAGVDKMIIPGAKLESSQKAIEIAQSNKNCFAAVGIHPHHIDDFLEADRIKLKENFGRLIQSDKVVAVGETGLDYHHYKGYPEITPSIKLRQKNLFLLHLDFSVKYHLPLIIHTRDAYDDMIGLLSAFMKKEHNLNGVFHCFSGNLSHLKQVLNMGFFVGFDGNITYRENQQLRDMAKNAGLERILLETDSPYLTPLPYRGERNEPKNVFLVADALSSIYNIEMKVIGIKSSENALRLFSI